MSASSVAFPISTIDKAKRKSQASQVDMYACNAVYLPPTTHLKKGPNKTPEGLKTDKLIPIRHQTLARGTEFCVCKEMKPLLDPALTPTKLL
eukprot:scaffold832_cov75-Skeletonema_dohrnii-CCMP3373.AAC.7